MDGRVAIVTGASGGLGYRFAEVLHGAGATVVPVARRLDRLEALATKLGGDRILPLQCDVSDPGDIERTVQIAEDRYGLVDVLVNNAGMSEAVPAEAESLENWQQIMDVNARGVFWFCREVGRRLIAAHKSGTIVNISSLGAKVAMAPMKLATYCASKGAVESLTRQLAVEWAKKGIRVNAIAPGLFRSELSAQYSTLDTDDPLTKHLQKNCPMGRWGETSDYDGALLFFASEASSYCTGQTLSIDGGWSVR
jgi:NAD(P)-dependent dehydrogenase (short-subunit alcohol dehydrogenase family)